MELLVMWGQWSLLESSVFTYKFVYLVHGNTQPNHILTRILLSTIPVKGCGGDLS